MGEEDIFEYDEDDYLTLRANEHEELRFEYTKKGLLKKITDNTKRTKELRYNIYGQPTIIKEFDNTLTRIYYDKEKQVPKKIRDGLDSSTLLFRNNTSDSNKILPITITSNPLFFFWNRSVYTRTILGLFNWH